MVVVPKNETGRNPNHPIKKCVVVPNQIRTKQEERKVEIHYIILCIFTIQIA